MDDTSTVTISSYGKIILRITWSAGYGMPVYTSDCAYTVLAAPD